MPGLCLFFTLLLIIYVSAIETLICRGEMGLIGFTSFGFAQNAIHDFQKKRMELIVALSSKTATKMFSLPKIESTCRRHLK